MIKKLVTSLLLAVASMGVFAGQQSVMADLPDGRHVVVTFNSDTMKVENSNTSGAERWVNYYDPCNCSLLAVDVLDSNFQSLGQWNKSSWIGGFKLRVYSSKTSTSGYTNYKLIFNDAAFMTSTELLSVDLSYSTIGSYVALSRYVNYSHTFSNSANYVPATNNPSDPYKSRAGTYTIEGITTSTGSPVSYKKLQ